MNDALKIISETTELNELSKYLNDDMVDQALEATINALMKPDITPSKAKPLIVKLQAMSAVFATKKTYYSTLERGGTNTDAGQKKQIYATMSENLDKLAQALKYLAKSGVFD